MLAERSRHNFADTFTINASSSHALPKVHKAGTPDQATPSTVERTASRNSVGGALESTSSPHVQPTVARIVPIFTNECTLSEISTAISLRFGRFCHQSCYLRYFLFELHAILITLFQVTPAVHWTLLSESQTQHDFSSSTEHTQRPGKRLQIMHSLPPDERNNPFQANRNVSRKSPQYSCTY